MTTSDWFIVSIVLVATIFDIIVICKKLKSISNRMRFVSKNLSLAPFSWGILGGHFWGPLNNPFLDSWVISISCLVSATIVVSVVHVLWKKFMDVPIWISLIYMLLGIPAGIIFWPQ